MFNDTDAHWWLAVDEKTGRMWLACRFGGVLLDIENRPAADAMRGDRPRRAGSRRRRPDGPTDQASS